MHTHRYLKRFNITTPNAAKPPDPFAVREPGFFTRFSSYREPQIPLDHVAIFVGEADLYVDVLQGNHKPEDPLSIMNFEYRSDQGLAIEIRQISKTLALTYEDMREILEAIQIYGLEWHPPNRPMCTDIEYQNKNSGSWETLARGELSYPGAPRTGVAPSVANL